MAQQIKKQTVANVVVSMIERDVVNSDFERLVWKFGLDLAF